MAADARDNSRLTEPRQRNARKDRSELWPIEASATCATGPQNNLIISGKATAPGHGGWWSSPITTVTERFYETRTCQPAGLPRTLQKQQLNQRKSRRRVADRGDFHPVRRNGAFSGLFRSKPVEVHGPSVPCGEKSRTTSPSRRRKRIELGTTAPLGSSSQRAVRPALARPFDLPRLAVKSLVNAFHFGDLRHSDGHVEQI